MFSKLPSTNFHDSSLQNSLGHLHSPSNIPQIHSLPRDLTQQEAMKPRFAIITGSSCCIGAALLALLSASDPSLIILAISRSRPGTLPPMPTSSPATSPAPPQCRTSARTSCLFSRPSPSSSTTAHHAFCGTALAGAMRSAAGQTPAQAAAGLSALVARRGRGRRHMGRRGGGKLYTASRRRV